MFRPIITLPVIVAALTLALVFALTSQARAAPRSDLKITYAVGPPEVLLRGTVFETAFIVRNSGRRTSPRSRAGVVLSRDRTLDDSDLPLGKISVRRLRSGQQQVRGLIMRTPTSADGIYHMLVCADVDRQVRESQEGRNCAVTDRSTFVRAR